MTAVFLRVSIITSVWDHQLRVQSRKASFRFFVLKLPVATEEISIKISWTL